MNEVSRENYPQEQKRELALIDLEKAKAELRLWEGRVGETSNNPDKYSSQIQDAAHKVRHIEATLKKAGVIEMTPEEKLTDELDKLYPNTRSRTVVEYQGQEYKIVYFPLATSRSGKTVHEWGHEWRLFKEKKSKKRPSR